MAVYYVATTGNDTHAGTQAAPWKTLQYAQGQLSGGDILHVAPGTYDQSTTSSYKFWYIHSSASGTSGAHTTIISDTPRGAKVTASGTRINNVTVYNEADYLDFIGFEVTGDGWKGIENYASHCSIQFCKVHDIPCTGAGSSGGAGIIHSNYSATNNDALGNLVYNIGVGTGSIYNQGIYHAMAGGNIKNNIVYNASANGIQLWHAATTVTITNNLSFANGLAGITVGAGDAPGSVTCQNCVVNNNIVRNNGSYGFRENGTVATNTFTNNLSYANTTAASLLVNGTQSGTLTSDPLMVNYQANGSGDYHLTGSSPAVNAGVSTGAPATDYDGVTRPQGASYDIGPYEYVSPGGPASGGFALYASGTGVASFDTFRVSSYPDPALFLGPAGRAGSSYVGWDSLLPGAAATLGIDTSLRGDGTDWIDVTGVPGGAIPGIYVQPDPTLDTFATDSSGNYSSTYRTGGAGAAWVGNTAKSRLEASGGTNGIYTYTGFAVADIDLLAITDGADSGGLVWRFVDQSNFYLCTFSDSLARVAYATTVLADGPRGYYRLDEASGTVAADSSGVSGAGTISATGVTKGVAGALQGDPDTAMSFDGSTGRVTLPTALDGGGYAGLSVECWIKPTTTGPTTGNFYNLVFGGRSGNNGYVLFFNSTPTIRFTVGNGTVSQTAAYAITVTPGLWYHVVGTYDGANVRLYVNGVLVATSAALTGAIVATAGVALAADTGGVSPFPGSLDEVAIYNTALSAPQIAAHYNGALGMNVLPQSVATLYKVAANVQTQLGQASVPFTRGTFHQPRVTMLRGDITVTWDGAPSITYTDASPLGAGLCGLYSSGGPFGSRYYLLWMTPQGDDVSDVWDHTKAYVYTRAREATTDTALTPQLLSQTLFVGGTNLDIGGQLPTADMGHTFINKNMDDLVKASAGYYWTIDDTFQLLFQKRTASPAPWVLYSSTLAPVDLEAGPGDLPLVEVANDLYRNRQTLTGVIGTGTFKNSFTGNGKDTSFPLSYPLAPGSVPTVKLNTVKQTVGPKGTTGAQWYYAPGDVMLAQDQASTILTGSDTLVVDPYQGTFLTSVTVNNVPGQAAQALVEGGGTGIVEAVEDVSAQAMDVPTATAYGNSLLARHGIAGGRTLTATTYRDGLAEGQLLTMFLPEYGVWNAQFLIHEIEETMQSQPGAAALYKYVITGSELAYAGSWAKLFAGGLG